MEFFASITDKRGRTVGELGPFPDRDAANAAAVAAWPDRESVTVSHGRHFDLRWINPRRILAESRP